MQRLLQRHATPRTPVRCDRGSNTGNNWEPSCRSGLVLSTLSAVGSCRCKPPATHPPYYNWVSSPTCHEIHRQRTQHGCCCHQHRVI
jgi:hypothetical protein